MYRQLSCPTYGASTLPRLSRRPCTIAASKGFGSSQPSKSSDKNEPAVQGQTTRKEKRVKFKGKTTLRQNIPQPPPRPQQQYDTVASPETSEASAMEQIEFEQRLKALEMESKLKKAEIQAQQASQGGILDVAAPPSYDNPPPISSTLFGNGSNDASKTSTNEDGSFGPSQVGLAVASLVLVGIFVLANTGSDLGYASRRPSASTSELGAEQRTDIENQLKEVEKKLEVDANDVGSLEAAAILHARLGEYSIAESQLEKLMVSKPDDVDVWRVLAETRAAAGEAGKSVDAYRKAWAASGQSNLDVLAGLAAALAADGRPQAAVDEIRSLGGNEAVKEKIGDVELGMLLAKSYSAWRGHAADAIAQYDVVIEAHPDDFRPLLGKGLLLREQGREGDAQRYLLQAKYLAPPSSRNLIDALANGKR